MREVIGKITKADWMFGIYKQSSAHILYDRGFGLEIKVTTDGRNSTVLIFGNTSGIVFMEELKIKTTQDLVGKQIILDADNSLSYVKPFDDSKTFVIKAEWLDEDLEAYIFVMSAERPMDDYRTLTNINNILGAPFNRINFSLEMVDKRLLTILDDGLRGDFCIHYEGLYND